VLLQSLSAPGDGVIVFSPVYYQFMELIRKNNRRVVASELVVQDNRYHMDLDALQQQLTGDEKILLLCSPHNPGGRIWTPEELRALADFCVRNDIIICSDEIHHDLIMPGHKHHLIAKVAPDVEDRLITMAATSKTFNIAGIETGSMFISDRKLRERIMPVYNAMSISPNRFGMTMAEAAYRGGDQWLDDLMVYLDRNRRQLNEAIAAIPGLSVMDLESTYLGWVDFSGTGMPADEVLKRLHEKGVVPSVGGTFGIGGEDYIRINIACRHAMLDDAMDRVTEAFSDLQ
jgi:cystathionine beta-lyase